jgi:hypothetical protein
MVSSTTVRPLNSLLVISDRDGGTPPVPVRGKLILSTNSCITVGCTSEQDGPTEVTLGRVREVDPHHGPSFDGELATPTGIVTISTVDGEIVLEEGVSTSSVRVRIWLNHSRWPDKVIVGLG